MRAEEKRVHYISKDFYDRILAEIQSVEEKVAWLLYHHPPSRNDDQYLIYLYWHHVDNVSGKLYSSIPLLTSAETITRARRKIQNDLGLFPPSEQEVIKRRNVKECAFRHYFGKVIEK